MNNTEDISIEEHWDIEIKPETRLFQLHLGEVWRYRDLLLLFVKRDFSAQYKQTILGPLWHVLQPAFTTLVYVFFAKAVDIDTGSINPVLFYLSGVTIWNYFNTCLTATSNTFVANAGIFGKVYFPRLVIPLSTVLSNLIKFGIQFLLLLLIIIYFGITTHRFHFGVSWAYIPLLVIMMAGLGLGLGIIISALTTKYRDLGVLISFAVQLLMFMSPVIYPVSFLQKGSYASLIAWNPLTPIIETFRSALFGTGSADISALLYSGTFIVITLFIGLVIFSKVERSFMDTV